MFETFFTIRMDLKFLKIIIRIEIILNRNLENSHLKKGLNKIRNLFLIYLIEKITLIIGYHIFLIARSLRKANNSVFFYLLIDFGV